MLTRGAAPRAISHPLSGSGSTGTSPVPTPVLLRHLQLGLRGCRRSSQASAVAVRRSTWQRWLHHAGFDAARPKQHFMAAAASSEPGKPANEPEGSQASTQASSAGVDGAGPSGRGRPTLAQMQQDARSMISELAAQQIAEQQQRQQLASASRGVSSRATAVSGPAASGWSSAAAGGTAATVDTATARARAPEQGQALEAKATSAPTPASQPGELEESSSDDITWSSLRAELEGDWQRLRDRWRQFVARPLDPPPAPQQRQPGHQRGRPEGRDGGPQPLEVVVPQVVGPDGSVLPSSSGSNTGSSSTPWMDSAGGAATGAAGAEAVSQQERGGEPQAEDGEAEDYDLVVQRGATRLLQLACLAVFAAQWAPVVQAVAGGGVAPPPFRDGILAMLLACPPTPVTMSLQMDVFSVSSGHWPGLLTSALLHSGLLSLLASLWSLDFTGAWLETAHGPTILAISLLMAGGGAAAGQLLAGQPAGIGGIGAALGLEAAVVVRSLRLAGELPPLRAGGVALVGVAAAMAVYQPLVGPWALVGGVVGGALSGVLAYDVLWLLRVVLGVTMLLCITAWDVLTWLPRQLWRVLVAVAAFAWGTVVAFVQAVRGV